MALRCQLDPLTNITLCNCDTFYTGATCNDTDISSLQPVYDTFAVTYGIGMIIAIWRLIIVTITRASPKHGHNKHGKANSISANIVTHTCFRCFHSSHWPWGGVGSAFAAKWWGIAFIMLSLMSSVALSLTCNTIPLSDICISWQGAASTLVLLAAAMVARCTLMGHAVVHPPTRRWFLWFDRLWLLFGVLTLASLPVIPQLGDLLFTLVFLAFFILMAFAGVRAIRLLMDIRRNTSVSSRAYGKLTQNITVLITAIIEATILAVFALLWFLNYGLVFQQVMGFSQFLLLLIIQLQIVWIIGRYRDDTTTRHGHGSSDGTHRDTSKLVIAVSPLRSAPTISFPTTPSPLPGKQQHSPQSWRPSPRPFLSDATSSTNGSGGIAANTAAATTTIAAATPLANDTAGAVITLTPSQRVYLAP
jgi:hypothetical protein